MANKRQVNSRQMAFGGILAAVSLVLMLLSSVIPVMSYGLPAIAGFFDDAGGHRMRRPDGGGLLRGGVDSVGHSGAG